MSTAKVANRTGKVIWLYPEQLEVHKGFNVRYDMGDITQMSKTIQQSGIRVPLRGYKSKNKTDDGWPMYVITDGHRRHLAANRIASTMEEPDFIPFIEEPGEYTDIDRTLDILVTGDNAKPLNMLEASIGIKRLVDAGWKQSDIAKKIGKSAMYVSDCLMLITEASEKLIKQIKDGQVPAYTVVEMLKANPVEKVETAVTKTIDKADKVAGAGKGKVKKSEIEEESGEALTQKSKKSAAAKETSVTAAGSEKKAEKVDESLTRLINAKTALKAQKGKQNEAAFGILNLCIKISKGTALPVDAIPYFFDEEVEASAEEEEEDTTTVSSSKKKASKKAAPAAKKSAKAAPAKKGKKAVADEEEPEEEELEDLPEEDDDEDIE